MSRVYLVGFFNSLTPTFSHSVKKTQQTQTDYPPPNLTLFNTGLETLGNKWQYLVSCCSRVTALLFWCYFIILLTGHETRLKHMLNINLKMLIPPRGQTLIICRPTQTLGT